MADNASQPLAYRMRPKSLDGFIGQKHLLKEDHPLRLALETGDLFSSIILWGPPGTGKTTLARIIANITQSEFIELSAVNVGKKDIEKAINKSGLFQRRIILFLDEIHRFNKAQQDFLLPFVEKGTITLIGATTENPSFEINNALLSRSRVFTLHSLESDDLVQLIEMALSNDSVMRDKEISISKDNMELIARLADGDARSALNILEIAASTANEITKEVIEGSAQRSLSYDAEGHYNLISAMHKSIRDSDPDAATYWIMRMLEAGEDPKYIARRLIRVASEDIGNANPQALSLAVSSKDAVEFLGYPECDTALVQAGIYLSLAPKSNSVYKAVGRAREVIEKTGNLGVPLVLRNAETKLMRDVGYGKGYKYAHDHSPEEIKEQRRLPEEIQDISFYEPNERDPK